MEGAGEASVCLALAVGGFGGGGLWLEVAVNSPNLRSSSSSQIEEMTLTRSMGF